MPLSSNPSDKNYYSGSLPVSTKFAFDKLNIVESNNSELKIEDMLSNNIIQFLLNTKIEEKSQGFYLFKDNEKKKHIVFVSNKYDDDNSRRNNLTKFGYYYQDAHSEYVSVDTTSYTEEPTEVYYVRDNSLGYLLITDINNGNYNITIE
jgi:hypothetical protein